jgi:uncharacterized membrane protein YdjX (TVP38/TMEM64 family)
MPRRLILRLLPAFALVAVAVAFFASGAASDLSASGLAAHERAWRAAAARDPATSLAAYVAVYAVLAAAGLPVAMILTVTGGVIFGPVRGAVAALAAANLAALIGYWAARSAFGPLMSRWLHAGEGRARRLVRDLRARGFWPILAARLMPLAPFALVNLAAGLARVRLRAFVGATLLGGLPSAFIGATLGAGLGDSLTADSLAEAMRSPLVWGPLLALAALSAAPVALARRRAAAPPARRAV